MAGDRIVAAAHADAVWFVPPGAPGRVVCVEPAKAWLLVDSPTEGRFQMHVNSPDAHPNQE